jgi:ribosomal protein S18 acetylase RimI-like enzyme
VSAPEYVIREATASDVYPCALLIASYESNDVEIWRERFGADLNDPHRQFFVGSYGEEIVGYGHAVRHTRPIDASSDSSPSGYFLSGLLVAPEYRRHGIGRLLTVARLQALKRVTKTVFYLAEPDNAATIQLHTHLGFVEERLVVREGKILLLFRLAIV